MSETPGDGPNDDPRLMTRIDGEVARLLVHIEPIEDAEDRPTVRGCRPQAPHHDSSGLAE
ncbi:MAG TPA: hypothetical protein VMZ73_03770 [Acidimicrobiales bacterium]|nr:hypothetical protein [Acidimicrobiales bacterium]